MQTNKYNNNIQTNMRSTPFSWEDVRKKALATKIRRKKRQAKLGHPDLKARKPDYSRDANDGKYTILIKDVTEEFNKKIEDYEARRNKLHGK